MQRITAGPHLEIRPDDLMAIARGRVLRLSARELAVLAVLAGEPERVLTRQDLYARAWGGELRDDDRSVDVYVHKLRSKLARALPEYRFIHTHYGLGYRFSVEPFTRLSQVGNESVTGSGASTATLAA